MSAGVDILENIILQRDPTLLNILLLDHSRPKHGKIISHIIWATDNYEHIDSNLYGENTAITIGAITGKNGDIIQPRVKKTKAEQQSRARDKGEVFTPSWICNCQNNLVDNEWLGYSGSFNEETKEGWKTNYNPIKFPTSDGRLWQDYVKDIRLEITCGEAPYIASRYDTISGEMIPVKDRIGLLDRKLRVIAENTSLREEWFEWVLMAYKSIYAYEWQGDNLLLARENALFTFIDYYEDKFCDESSPSMEQIRMIAEIISWNFWQMDGLKGVVPNSCFEKTEESTDLFGEPEITTTKCEGCDKNDLNKHNGIYCKIMDWEKGKAVRYIDLINH